MHTLTFHEMEKVEGGRDIDICGIKMSATTATKISMASMMFGWGGLAFTALGAGAYVACKYIK